MLCRTGYETAVTLSYQYRKTKEGHLSTEQQGETRLCSLCPLWVCLVKTFMKVTDPEQTRIKTLYWGRGLLEYSSLMSLISSPLSLLWRLHSLRKQKIFLFLSWAYAVCPKP